MINVNLPLGNRIVLCVLTKSVFIASLSENQPWTLIYLIVAVTHLERYLDYLLITVGCTAFLYEMSIKMKFEVLLKKKVVFHL